MQTVIPNAGADALNQALINGPLKVVTAKFGNSLISGNTTAYLETLTDVSGYQFSVGVSDISYSVLGNNVIQFIITLDQTIGDYDIGNYALFDDSGNMILLVALDKTVGKYKTNSPSGANKIVCNPILKFTNSEAAIDFTVYTNEFGNLPTVNTNTALPSVQNAGYNAYIVLSDTTNNGYPNLALKTSSGWAYLSPSEIASYSSQNLIEAAQQNKIIPEGETINYGDFTILTKLLQSISTNGDSAYVKQGTNLSKNDTPATVAWIDNTTEPAYPRLGITGGNNTTYAFYSYAKVDNLLGNKVNISDGKMDALNVSIAGGGLVMNNTGAPGYASWTRVTSTASDGLLDFYSNVGSAGKNVARISADGSFYIFGGGMFQGTATSAELADLAEYYTSKEQYEKGTFIKISECEDYEIEAAVSGDYLFGVISTAPGLVLNSNLKSKGGLPVALTGRVPAKIIGPIKKGQPVCLSSTAGVGTYGKTGILGFALQTNLDEGIKLVEIAIGGRGV